MPESGFVGADFVSPDKNAEYAPIYYGASVGTVLTEYQEEGT